MYKRDKIIEELSFSDSPTLTITDQLQLERTEDDILSNDLTETFSHKKSIPPSTLGSNRASIPHSSNSSSRTSNQKSSRTSSPQSSQSSSRASSPHSSQSSSRASSQHSSQSSSRASSRSSSRNSSRKSSPDNSQYSNQIVNRSKYWIHFKRINDNLAKCSLCPEETQLIKTCGNTTNIGRHLRKHHKKQYDQIKIDPISENNLGKFGFKPKTYKCSDNDIKEVIINHIVQDLKRSSRSIVEEDGFIKIFNLGFPDFKMPCRETVTRLIENKYYATKQLLLKELSSVTSVAITTDGWTAKYSNKCLTTITVHYINPRTQQDLKAVVLDSHDFGFDSKTAENISNQLNSTFVEWNIKGNLKFDNLI